MLRRLGRWKAKVTILWKQISWLIILIRVSCQFITLLDFTRKKFNWKWNVCKIIKQMLAYNFVILFILTNKLRWINTFQLWIHTMRQKNQINKLQFGQHLVIVLKSTLLLNTILMEAIIFVLKIRFIYSDCQKIHVSIMV